MGIFSLVSGYYKIDTSPCLNTLESSVNGMRVNVETYERLSDAERIMAVQRALKQRGYKVASINGELDAATRQAISRFEMDTYQVPTGQVSARPLLTDPSA